MFDHNICVVICLLLFDLHLCQQGPLDFLQSPMERCQWYRSFLLTWRHGLLVHLLHGESPLRVFKDKYLGRQGSIYHNRLTNFSPAWSESLYIQS